VHRIRLRAVILAAVQAPAHHPHHRYAGASQRRGRRDSVAGGQPGHRVREDGAAHQLRTQRDASPRHGPTGTWCWPAPAASHSRPATSRSPAASSSVSGTRSWGSRSRPAAVTDRHQRRDRAGRV